MGTFLRVIGIIVIIIGIAVMVFSFIGTGGLLNFMNKNMGTSFAPGTDQNVTIPWVGMALAGAGGAIGGFAILIGGVVLLALGTIYND
ncbi:MAG: hypothetical protein WCP87_06560, partial [Atribacterota bacterium]